MKAKQIVALCIGLVCLAVLSVGLVLALGRNDKTPPETEDDVLHTTPGDMAPQETDPPKDEDTTEDEETTEDNSADDQPSVEVPDTTTEEKDENQQDDPTEGEKEPENNEPPKVDETPVPDEPAQVAAPDTSTKEGIQRILNDPYMLLVNREHKVSSDYVASDLVYFNDYQLNSTCSSALRKLVNAGKNAGYSYILYSGYRTYSSQYNKYYNKIAGYKNQGYSEEEAIRLTDRYYAPPGGSEHHTGLAADVCIPSVVNKYGMLHENYEYTEEFKWFSQNAHKYGFILRYPKGKESITGYSYEPWHYRYVGVSVATEIYNRNLTLEEYVAELQNKLAAMN